MKWCKKRLIVPLASLATLTLAGCETLTPFGKSEPVPANAAAIAGSIGNMETEAADTCRTKQNAAKINSKIDTLKSGKETVYKADCALQPKKTS